MSCQARGGWETWGCVEELPSLRNRCRNALRLGLKSVGRRSSTSPSVVALPRSLTRHPLDA